MGPPETPLWLLVSRVAVAFGLFLLFMGVVWLVLSGLRNFHYTDRAPPRQPAAPSKHENIVVLLRRRANLFALLACVVGASIALGISAFWVHLDGYDAFARRWDALHPQTGEAFPSTIPSTGDRTQDLLNRLRGLRTPSAAERKREEYQRAVLHWEHAEYGRPVAEPGIIRRGVDILRGRRLPASLAVVPAPPEPPPLAPKYTQAEAIVLVQSHLQKTVVRSGDISTNCMDKMGLYLLGATWTALWANDVWTVRATQQSVSSTNVTYVFSWALYEKLGVVGLAQADGTGEVRRANAAFGTSTVPAATVAKSAARGC